VPQLHVFVDESGNIPKDKSNEYFVIALLFTSDEVKLRKVFRKSLLKTVKKQRELYEKLIDNHEVKGSDLTEKQKETIYKSLLSKCKDDFEIGIIVLDCSKTDNNFRLVTSRTFDFLTKEFIQEYFVKYGRLYNKNNSLCFIIDERNVTLKSRNTLKEYLNTELNLELRTFDEDISVCYSDSKKYLLLQLVDYISNTYFRFLKRYDMDAEANIKLLSGNLCNQKVFKFPDFYIKGNIYYNDNTVIQPINVGN